MAMRKQREDEFKPTFVDMTYLCPKDPNYQKIKDAEGWVATTADAPTHLGGFITDIQFRPKKHNIVGPDGRPMQFETQEKSAVWVCAKDGSEVKLDPYKV